MARYPLAGQRLTADTMAELARRGQVIGYWRNDGGGSFANTVDTVAATAVEWDTAVLDIDGLFNPAQPTRIAPSVSGWYMLYGAVSYASSNSGQRRGCAWRINGQAVPGGQSRVYANPIATGLTTAEARPKPIDLHAGNGDYVELVGIQDSGGSLSISGSSWVRPYMMLAYLGPL